MSAVGTGYAFTLPVCYSESMSAPTPTRVQVEAAAAASGWEIGQLDNGLVAIYEKGRQSVTVVYGKGGNIVSGYYRIGVDVARDLPRTGKKAVLMGWVAA